MANPSLIKQKLFPRALLFLALILSCALQSRAETTETISSTAADWGYENGSVVSQVTVGDFTLTFSIGTGSNAPAYYTSDSTMRFYKGNTVTVTSSKSAYVPTKFGSHELTDGKYSFTDKERFTTVTITYENKGVMVDDLFYSFDESIATVMGYCGSITNLAIPNEVEYNGQTYSVTSIGRSAFEGCVELTSVIIGNSVTSVGDNAFQGCTGLVKSAYPNTISKPFSNGVTVSYPAKNSLIEDGVIWSSDKTKLYFVPIDYQGEFVIPNSVTSIGDYAFQSCTELTSVSIPETVTSLGNWTFDKCAKLESVNIPSSVTSIGEHTFGACTGLTSLTIPNSVTSIGDSAFYGCTGLTKVNLSDLAAWCGISFGSEYANPLRYAKHLYLNDQEITDLVIPDSVTSIGNYAFYGCTGLTSLTIPNSVASIGDCAFYQCSGLTSVIIGKSVTSVGDNAFQSCTGLIKSIHPNTISNPFPKGGSQYYIGDVLIENGVVLSPDKKQLYFVIPDYQGEFTIPNSVTGIYYAFRYCSGLTSVTIPNSVTTIGSSAFQDCTGLTSVTIPNSVTSIDNSAFSGCTGLVKSAYPNSISKPFSNGVTVSYPEKNSLIEDGVIWSSDKTKLYFVPIDYQGEFVIPNSVTSIGDYAFYGCTGLTSLTIPNSVTSIGGSAFWDCTGLTSLTIPNSVTSIGGSAFWDCTGLTSVTIPNSVTSIGNNAFYGCTGLTSLTIPNSVTSIGWDAFDGCTSITELNIADSETKLTIGSDAFSNVKPTKVYLGRNISSAIFKYNTNLADLTIGDKVTTINNSEFSGCTGLTNVNIIDLAAWCGISFGNYYSNPLYYASHFNLNGQELTDVIIPETVTSIGQYAFDNFKGLSSVTIPNSVTSIGNYAFYGCRGLTSVTIPNSVTSIGTSAFKGCTGLQWIESKATTPPTITEDTFSDYNVPLFAASEDYKTADYWKNFTNLPAEYTPTGRTFEENGLKYEIIDVNDYTCRLYGINESVEGDVVIPATVTYREREFTPIEISGVLIKGETPITSLTIPSNIATIASGSVLDASLAKVIVNTAITNNITVRTSIDELVIAPSVNEFSNDLNSNTIGKLTIEDGETSLTTTQFKGVIKELYLGRNVSENTFAGLTSLEKVSISDKVTSIEQSTFSGCSGMSELNIAESETELTIGDDAFSNVKPTKAYLGRDISSAIFTGDTNLSDLTIGDKVTSINESEFSGCTGLTSVTIPNSVTSIGSSGFYGCTGLTLVTIPNSVTSIGTYAFQNCTGITELNIADSETELTIGSSAFSNVKPTKAYLGRDISSAIFTGDTNLSDLTIGDKVTVINGSEFKGCTSLSEVTIPNSVSKLGSFAFEGCTGLTAFVIPSPVTSIGASAFSGCTEISDLNIADSGTELTIGSHAFLNVKPTKVYLGRSISSAIFTEDTNLSDLTIGGKVTAINDSEFKGCTRLTSVIIPNSVTSIGDYAFQSCTELTSVSIPETVTSLGSWTFDKCVKLESVNIPSSITSIGEHTFWNCTGLTSLTIPNTVTSIGGAAFYGCTGVTELNIADSKTELTIGGSAFSNVKPTKAYLGRNISSAIFTEDTNLSDLTIGDKVTAINDSEFKGCTSLSELKFPSSVTSIGSSAFNGCSALTALTIPNSVTTIGNDAFGGCTGIAELKFDDGESELTLGDDAFKDVALKEIYFGRQMNFANAPVAALETVEFGENVTSIETGEFKEVKSLLSVTSRNTVPPTTENPFNDDTYLDGTLYVPATAIETYKAAAGWKNFWTVKAIDGISSGVSEIGDNSNATFSVENGAICVDGDADVRVVSMNGTTVYSGRGETRINLTPGVYIVIINDTPTKVAVK